MIADDFPAIAKRWAQIAKERQHQRFALPGGVMIVLRAKLYPGMKIPPHCDLCFVLDERISRLLLINEGSRTSLSKPFGQAFVHYLKQFCPSVEALSPFEARMSREDALTLQRLLEET